jgi:hypothetical protein
MEMACETVASVFASKADENFIFLERHCDRVSGRIITNNTSLRGCHIHLRDLLICLYTINRVAYKFAPSPSLCSFCFKMILSIIKKEIIGLILLEKM